MKIKLLVGTPEARITVAAPTYEKDDPQPRVCLGVTVSSEDSAFVELTLEELEQLFVALQSAARMLKMVRESDK